MEFSKNIIDIIRFNGIPVNDGLTTLLILHYGIEKDNSIMNDRIISKLSMAGVIDYDYNTEKYTINEPLFDVETLSLERPKTDWKKRFPDDFIKEYVSLFKKVNKERSADRTSVRKKMSDLIELRDSTVTNDEIMEAAKLYTFRMSERPNFIMQADYFIHHRDKGFTIMTYIEEIRENKEKGISDNTSKFEDTL